MNATIARLHAFEPGKIGLGDFGRGENYVARQVERWSKQYRASETEKIEEMERLIAWLPAHIPPAGPARLVHGDYRLDNLIVARERPEILAVLDWELSTLGDPLADFTYHLMAWHMPQTDSAAGTATLAGHDLAALGIPSMEDYVDDYVARTGLDPRPHLPAYLAYNFFRIAAILQGIIGRVRDGTATSEFAPAKAEMIRPLAEKAWDFARAGRKLESTNPFRARAGIRAIASHKIDACALACARHEHHHDWYPDHHAEDRNAQQPQPPQPANDDARRAGAAGPAAARHGQVGGQDGLIFICDRLSAARRRSRAAAPRIRFH